MSPAPELQGTLLVAPNAPQLPACRLQRDGLASGWERTANPAERGRFETQLGAEGWKVHFIAGAVAVKGFGFSRPKMLAAALGRLIDAVKLQGCNCAEVDEVQMRSIFGIPYVSISGHPRHIQKSMLFRTAIASA